MDELLAGHGVAGADADHLHRLVADWQLLADLSFADLILFVASGADRFTAVAQMRPTTGPTAYQDDVVGLTVSSAERPQLAVAVLERRICREGDPVWLSGVPVREEAIPVVRSGRVVAVVARDTNLAAARTPSRLEIAYLRSAAELAQMLAEGRWPYPGEAGSDDGSGPRVGDGLVRLEPDGTVSYASPNALSAYRRLGHLGDLIGLQLAEVTAALGQGPTATMEEPAAVVASGRVPRLGEVEAQDAVVQLRSIPLRPHGEHIGAIVLVRDVTELRRRERQLIGKDATIREIHHRVKNNLQTVAALLRLQARRMAAPEARAALEESVRRISSIAVVHETLSGTLDESVPFDDIVDRITAMVADVGTPHPGDLPGSSPRPAVRLVRRGTFGVLPAEVATPLAMVVAELLQNALEHGYVGPDAAGTVELVAERAVRPGSEGSGPALELLRVQVLDDGRGLPAGFTLDGSHRLGLQIVRTLVETELAGRLLVESRPGGGTQATVEIALPASSAG